MVYYQGHKLDEPLPVDLKDQFFLPNTIVAVEVFLGLIPETRAFINYMVDELLTHCLN